MFSRDTQFCNHTFSSVKSDSLPLHVIARYWVEFPVLHSWHSSIIYFIYTTVYMGSQVALAVKHIPASAGRHKRGRFDPWVGKIPWGRAWQLTPVFLPGESHRQRSLVRYGWTRLKQPCTHMHSVYVNPKLLIMFIFLMNRSSLCSKGRIPGLGVKEWSRWHRWEV